MDIFPGIDSLHFSANPSQPLMGPQKQIKRNLQQYTQKSLQAQNDLVHVMDLLHLKSLNFLLIL